MYCRSSCASKLSSFHISNSRSIGKQHLDLVGIFRTSYWAIEDRFEEPLWAQVCPNWKVLCSIFDAYSKPGEVAFFTQPRSSEGCYDSFESTEIGLLQGSAVYVYYSLSTSRLIVMEKLVLLDYSCLVGWLSRFGLFSEQLESEVMDLFQRGVSVRLGTFWDSSILLSKSMEYRWLSFLQLPSVKANSLWFDTHWPPWEPHCRYQKSRWAVS